jgi:hypothetical protein
LKPFFYNKKNETGLFLEKNLNGLLTMAKELAQIQEKLML